VLDDAVEDVSGITRVVLATGKVAHEAIARRNEINATDVAVVRIEQIYPWPVDDLATVLARYQNLDELVWLQEEPKNMGAWPFVHHELHRHLREMKVRHVARAESASPATGSSLVHTAEQADLLRRAIG
jgi:2-oxoglutarate dehydrogenase E1 component